MNETATEQLISRAKNSQKVYEFQKEMIEYCTMDVKAASQIYKYPMSKYDQLEELQVQERWNRVRGELGVRS